MEIRKLRDVFQEYRQSNLGIAKIGFNLFKQIIPPHILLFHWALFHSATPVALNLYLIAQLKAASFMLLKPLYILLFHSAF